MQELDDALAWLTAQPHPYKLFIAGNHDLVLASAETRKQIPSNLIYLENSATELRVRGRILRVYGSPYTPKHGSRSFQYPRLQPESYTDSDQRMRDGPWSSMRWDHAQKVYEDICAGKAGWTGLMKLFWYRLISWLRRPLLTFGHYTIFVNAAAVAGLMDERKTGAIVIDF